MLTTAYPFPTKGRVFCNARGRRLDVDYVSARRGINQPALSRLENGHTPNPTPDTLWRYAAALGKRLVLTAEDVAETRARRGNGGHAVVKKMAAREKGTA
jgi:transcriptional regulator with XRE-family HTH domain